MNFIPFQSRYQVMHNTLNCSFLQQIIMNKKITCYQTKRPGFIFWEVYFYFTSFFQEVQKEKRFEKMATEERNYRKVSFQRNFWTENLFTPKEPLYDLERRPVRFSSTPASGQTQNIYCA